MIYVNYNISNSYLKYLRSKCGDHEERKNWKIDISKLRIMKSQIAKFVNYIRKTLYSGCGVKNFKKGKR